jgi:uncharacterized membrane protein required for colicin V production
MWLDGLALLILGWFFWAGARKGGVAAGMGLATLAVSYGGAIAVAPRLGPWVASQFDLSEWIGIPIAGSIGFAVVFAAMTIISVILRRRADVLGEEGRSLRDRFLGGAFGAIRGAFLVVLLSYLVLWIDVLRQTGAAEGMPAVGGSAAVAVTESLVEAGVEAALSDSGRAGRVVANLAARPGTAMADLQAVIANPNFVRVQNDRRFWANVEAGAVGAALNTGSFIDLAQDAELREQMAALGLIDSEAAERPGLFRAAVDEVMREVGPRIRGLRNDPELQELIEDPEIVAMVESGDTFGLMSHPRFHRLVTRVVSAPVID